MCTTKYNNNILCRGVDDGKTGGFEKRHGEHAAKMNGRSYILSIGVSNASGGTELTILILMMVGWRIIQRGM